MPKEMLINVSAGEECRIALLDDGKLDELYMERASTTSHVGNVYKGKVTNVEASIQAAFVDFGIGRNGFLHISDLMPTYFGRKGDGVTETVGRKMARRDRPPIQHCLRRGDEIIVQVIKEGIGTKGPTLSTYLSIPGRILVMMPGVGKTGVSRKIEDDEERRRLRKILDELKPPKEVGFIIRTAGVGKTKAEIERDFKYLTRLHDQIEKTREGEKGPVELYAEGDLVMRTVRDVWTQDIEQILVDDKATAKRIKDFFKLMMPRTKNRVEVYEETVPLFHKYGIESDIEQMHSRTVPLKSGGYLIIDQTEAVVAIDVNSGKFREHGDAETTAFKTDLEAADEIPRQLKLRDMGGVVICDFIDLRFERHRRELEARLAENLKKDRAKTRFLRMSEFGIIEMTRQRMRPSLKRSVFHDCPQCAGHGLVKTPESMSLDVMRRLAIAASEQKVRRVELSLAGEVAFHMLNRKRAALAELESRTDNRIVIKVDEALGLDEMKFELFDEREGPVILATLGMEAPHSQGRHGRNDRRDRRHDRRHREEERDTVRDELETEGDDGPSMPAREPDPQDLQQQTERSRGESRSGPRAQTRVESPEEAGDEQSGPVVGEAPGYSEVGDRDGGRRRRRRRRGGRGRRRGQGENNSEQGQRIYTNDDGIDTGDDDVDTGEDAAPAPRPPASELREAREPREKPQPSENRQPREERPPRDDRTGRDDRPQRDDRAPRDQQGQRDNRDNREGRDNRDNRNQRGSRDPRAPRDHRDQRDNRDHRGPRENRGPQDARRGDDRGNRLPPTAPVQVVPDDVDPEDDIQPPNVSHEMTSRGFEDGKRRRRRGGRGRGRGREQEQPPKIDPREQPVAAGPSLAERLRDELSRERDRRDDDDRGNRVAPAERNGGQRQAPRNVEPRAPRASSPPPVKGETSGSSDKHHLDDVQHKLPDLSEFLRPAKLDDLDVIPEDDFDD
jgi:ribonuclease E